MANKFFQTQLTNVILQNFKITIYTCVVFTSYSEDPDCSASEWGVPEWRALLQGKEFTDDDDGVRRVITDVVFSHEDDVYCAKYIIKGEKDIKKNHEYTILRQVFDIARDGGDDWV